MNTEQKLEIAVKALKRICYPIEADQFCDEEWKLWHKQYEDGALEGEDVIAYRALKEIGGF